jgi:tetratricopeptide (TPR) repeat protein
MLCVYQGDGGRAIEHAEQAIKYAEPLQNLVVLSIAWHSLGFGHSLLRDYENALKYMQKSREIMRDSGIPDLSMALANRCLPHIGLGDLANARSYAEKAAELAQKEQNKSSEGLSSMNLGLILAMQDKSRLAEAEGCIIRGMEIVNELKIRPWYAQGYLYLGEVYALTGQREKALENLKKAEAMYRALVKAEPRNPDALFALASFLADHDALAVGPNVSRDIEFCGGSSRPDADIAAACLIVREAGGQVLDMEGRTLDCPIDLSSRISLLAGAGKICSELWRR